MPESTTRGQWIAIAAVAMLALASCSQGTDAAEDSASSSKVTATTAPAATGTRGTNSTEPPSTSTSGTTATTTTEPPVSVTSATTPPSTTTTLATTTTTLATQWAPTAGGFGLVFDVPAGTDRFYYILTPELGITETYSFLTLYWEPLTGIAGVVNSWDSEYPQRFFTDDGRIYLVHQYESLGSYQVDVEEFDLYDSGNTLFDSFVTRDGYEYAFAGDDLYVGEWDIDLISLESDPRNERGVPITNGALWKGLNRQQAVTLRGALYVIGVFTDERGRVGFQAAELDRSGNLVQTSNVWYRTDDRIPEYSFAADEAAGGIWVVVTFEGSSDLEIQAWDVDAPGGDSLTLKWQGPGPEPIESSQLWDLDADGGHLVLWPQIAGDDTQIWHCNVDCARLEIIDLQVKTLRVQVLATDPDPSIEGRFTAGG